MKKKEILEALKTRFAGVSEAILDRIATKLAKTVTTDEEVTTSVEGVTLQQLIDSYTENRVTEASKTAVTNYEKQFGLKDGLKVEAAKAEGGTPSNEPKATDSVSPEILAQLKELSDKVQQMTGEKIATTRKQMLTQAVEKAPVEFKDRIVKDFERMTFNTEEDYTAWVTEVKTNADTLSQSMTVRGAAFAKPIGGGVPPEGDVPAHLKEYLEKKPEEGGQKF